MKLGIHLDSDELIGNRVRERNVHKEMVKDAYPYAPQAMESSPAWEFICISTGCPARGEVLAFVIIFTVNAELSQ